MKAVWNGPKFQQTELSQTGPQPSLFQTAFQIDKEPP